MIVSNSSPLMNLAIVGHLDLFSKLFEKITVPQEVREELVVEGKGKPGAKLIEQANWVEIKKVENHSLVQLLNKDLDRGEAAAIALAVEQQASLILIDETDAREMADLYGIPKTGVLGILIKSKKANLIENIKPILDALRTQAHFHLKPDLYQRILNQVGESV